MSARTTRFSVQAVLFDMDGTLVDSAPDLALAAERMRAARQLPPLGLSRYRAHASSGARGMLQIALGVAPTDSAYDTLKAEFIAEYRQCLLHQTRCFDEVPELLAVLQRARLPWGIVTNKAQFLTTEVLAGLPVLAPAATVICGDTTAYAKPHPEPLFEAARRIGVSPHSCLYVGDDERDIVAGRAAGMRTVAAAYGYLGESGRTDHWQADADIKTPAGLLKILELP